MQFPFNVGDLIWTSAQTLWDNSENYMEIPGGNILLITNITLVQEGFWRDKDRFELEVLHKETKCLKRLSYAQWKYHYNKAND